MGNHFSIDFDEVIAVTFTARPNLVEEYEPSLCTGLLVVGTNRFDDCAGVDGVGKRRDETKHVVEQAIVKIDIALSEVAEPHAELRSDLHPDSHGGAM